MSFLAQDRDGLLDVAARFHKRGTAIRETGVGPLAQFLYELCRDLHCWLLCTHPFFSLLIGNFLWCTSYKKARTESLGAGLAEFLPAQIALAFFLVVRRNSGFGRFRRGFHNALDEVALLLFVLFVCAGIDVFDAIHQCLIFRGLLIR